MRDFQCLTLVAAGNAALRGVNLGRFWPDALVFRWTEQVEFVVPRSPTEFAVVAADPPAWFDWLKGNYEGLRLHTAPMRQNAEVGAMPERMLAGMVGGGPRWLIEVVGESRSLLWEGYDRLGDRDAPDRRIWRTAYVLEGETERQDAVADADIAAAAQDLDTALVEIEAVARAIDAANFADVFADARAALSKAPDEEHDLGAPLSEPARRVVAAAMRASVFGGMGSWNDMGVADAHKRDYERTSEALFLALQRAVAAAANSTFSA